MSAPAVAPPRPLITGAQRPASFRRPRSSRPDELATFALGLAGVAVGNNLPGASLIASGSVALGALLAALLGLSVVGRIVDDPALAGNPWRASPFDAAVALSLGILTGPLLPLALGLTAVTRSLPASARTPSARRRSLSAANRAWGAGGVAVAVAVVVDDLSGGTVAGAAAGVLAWWLVTDGLAAGAVARTSGRRLAALVRRRARANLPGAALGGSLGVTATWFASHAPAGLLGLLGPAALLWTAIRHEAARRAQARALEELVGTVGAGRSLDDAASALTVAAARLLGGVDVELVVVVGGEVVRYSGNEQGAPVRTRLGLGELDDPWLAKALSGRGTQGRPGAPGGPRRGVDGQQWVLAVPLGQGPVPVAALLARRSSRGAPFSAEEVLRAQALAGQATSWLPLGVSPSAQSRSGLDLPPEVAPLHQAASRLLRLAVPGVEAAAVLDEVRQLEAAVAVLLGAVSPPDQDAAPVSGARAPRFEPDQGWTTSGVLS